MSREAFNLQMANRVENHQHLGRLLNGYLQKGLRDSVPLVGSDIAQQSTKGSNDLFMVGGFLNAFPGMRQAQNRERAMTMLGKWWLSEVKDRKLKAHHLIFDVKSDFTSEARRHGILMADRLPTLVTETLDQFRDTFYPDELFGYVNEVHRDKDHPHAHCLVFPYTKSGTRISFSSSYRYPGREDGMVRNHRAAAKSIFAAKGERIAEAMKEPSGPKEVFSEDLNAFTRAALAECVSVAEDGELQYKKYEGEDSQTYNHIFRERSVDDTRNQEALDERVRSFFDTTPDDLATHFKQAKVIGEEVAEENGQAADLSDWRERLELENGPDKGGTIQERYKQIRERRGLIYEYARDVSQQRKSAHTSLEMLHFFLSLGAEKVAAFTETLPIHARRVKSAARLFPTFEERTSNLLRNNKTLEWKEREEAFKAALKVPGNEFTQDLHPLGQLPSNAEDWGKSEAIRVSKISPNEPFVDFNHMRSGGKKFPEAELPTFNVDI